MAYGLHIERQSGGVPLEEWLSALESVDDVRQRFTDTVAINPETGEEIRIARNDGDAEVLFREGGFLGLGRREEWHLVFSFFNERVSFKAAQDIESPRNPVRRVAAQLAAALNATVVGDEGETYDW
ncbi:MAG: hypothetical protein AAFX10_01980 [Pseudomonadota bacterium]